MAPEACRGAKRSGPVFICRWHHPEELSDYRPLVVSAFRAYAPAEHREGSCDGLARNMMARCVLGAGKRSYDEPERVFHQSIERTQFSALRNPARISLSSDKRI